MPRQEQVHLGRSFGRRLVDTLDRARQRLMDLIAAGYLACACSHWTIAARCSSVVNL